MMNERLYQDLGNIMHVLTVEKNYSHISISNNVENYYGFEVETANFEICVDEDGSYVREITGNPRKIIYRGTVADCIGFIRKF